MNRTYFGTDGIRGTANKGVMTAETALLVGMAAGQYFRNGDFRHRVLIGKDTRLSCYMIENALTAGFTSVGMDVVVVGPMPTPAIAMLTPSLRANLGVMISASHNPYYDNGIKLFGPDGYKLSDAVELEIEQRMAGGKTLAAGADIGRARRLDDAPGRYIEFVKRVFPDGLRLDGLKIVIDCANGAAYKVAPTVLWELEAEVIAVGDQPDGFNINKDCGSTSPGNLSSQVVKHNADLGIALDGDADRVVMCDENGTVIDGDQLMALIAATWQAEERLRGNGVVATVMSNLGLEHYLGGLDLSLIRTQVGDRYVAEQMRRDGYNVGGEQSGHIILNDFVTTGDGLIAALQTLAAVVRAGQPVSEVCHMFDPFPQVLRNVRYGDRAPLEDKTVQQAITDGTARLGQTGRLLIRKSGTEPLVRVMGEGEDEGLVVAVVNDIVTAIEQVQG